MANVKLLNLAKCKTDKDGKFISGGEIIEKTQEQFERWKNTLNYKEYYLLIEEQES